MTNAETQNKGGPVPSADKEPPKTYVVNAQGEARPGHRDADVPDPARVKRGRRVFFGFVGVAVAVLVVIAFVASA